MLVGAFHFPTDYGIEMSELAHALETRGFELLFVCEHTHIPVSRRSPYPGGGELPKRYSHTHDPFVALSFAAAATRTLKLGTGIALVPQRDPSSPRNQWRASTSFQAAGSFSRSVAVGTSRRWRITAPIMRPVSSCCANAYWR